MLAVAQLRVCLWVCLSACSAGVLRGIPSEQLRARFDAPSGNAAIRTMNLCLSCTHTSGRTFKMLEQHG
jgi:hypothetical protein